MKKKKILLVGWGTETARYILAECTKLKSYTFYLATTKNDLLKIKKFFNKNRLLITNPYDEKVLCEDVEEYCQVNKIKFDVVTTFFEMCVYQTAFLADYLGIRDALSLAGALKTSVNKYLMRLGLEKNKIRQPKFFKFSKNSISQAFEFFKKNCRKAIIKPVHSGHSYGVRFLEERITFDGFKKLVDEAIFDYKKDYDEWMKYENINNLEFLIEEFIDGEIFSFDGFAKKNSEVEFIGMTEFELSKPPIMQQVGHTSPIYSLTKKQVDNGHNYVRKIVKILGLEYCGFHCELKFVKNDPYLIEISGRLPGAIISRTYQNLSEYNLFDRFFGIFGNKKRFVKNKEFFKSESMKIVFSDKKIGIVRGDMINEKKEKDLLVDIRSRKDGEVLLEKNNSFGVWLYDIDVKSKNLISKELRVERDKLINKQSIRVRGNLYLYMRYFFNTIKDILKKYIYV